MINKKPQNQSGFTLIETIFYIVLLAVFSVVIINTLLVMTRSFREVAVQRDIVNASSIMERITREIKQASSVNTISTNNLVLNTTDTNNESITLEFDFADGDIEILEDSSSLGNLNSDKISIDSLTFEQITSSASVAVKVSLVVSSTRDSEDRGFGFYDTLVLRGSY